MGIMERCRQPILNVAGRCFNMNIINNKLVVRCFGSSLGSV
jgi:hypothetical protein